MPKNLSPNDITSSETYLRESIEEAQEAFWNVIVKRYPEATTGNLSPGATIDFHVAADNAVGEWVRNNCPSDSEAL
jgi:hypothetical protein